MIWIELRFKWFLHTAILDIQKHLRRGILDAEHHELTVTYIVLKYNLSVIYHY